jgi:hypothetical protein
MYEQQLFEDPTNGQHFTTFILHEMLKQLCITKRYFETH